jgi:H+-transporting ATPase
MPNCTPLPSISSHCPVLLCSFKNGREAIEFSIVVLVASIPLALEIVVTTTLALGSRELASDGAIVTRLAAIEDLSGMNILCSDKTGTLTINKMVIQDECPTFMRGLDRDNVLLLAALAAKWKEPPRDALDTLVLTSADLSECDKYNQIDFTPFDPTTKYTAAKLRGPDGEEFQVAKGAPHVILKMCGYDTASIFVAIACSLHAVS